MCVAEKAVNNFPLTIEPKSAFFKSRLPDPSCNGCFESWSAPEKCGVMVLYEEVPSRDLALRVCDRISQNFAGDLEFEFTWWGLRYLSDAQVSLEARRFAMEADLIIVAVQRTALLSMEVLAWFEHSLLGRRSPGGALAVLQTTADDGSLPWQHPYLLSLAQRSHLDYLPLSVSDLAPEENGSSPGEIVLPHLSRTPDQNPQHFTGWGINE